MFQNFLNEVDRKVGDADRFCETLLLALLHSLPDLLEGVLGGVMDEE
jgi:hypothetical protein